VPASIEFRVPEPTALRSLETRLRAVPALVVRRQSLPPREGELGFFEFLTVIGAAAALNTAIGLLPDFLGSRRNPPKISIKVGDTEISIEDHDTEKAVATALAAIRALEAGRER
jgi:hypothetical protein